MQIFGGVSNLFATLFILLSPVRAYSSLFFFSHFFYFKLVQLVNNDTVNEQVINKEIFVSEKIIMKISLVRPDALTAALQIYLASEVAIKS